MKHYATPVSRIIIAIILSLCLLAGTVVASAEEIQTQWNAADMSVDIAAGENGYTFRSIYITPTAAYEMSNHMVTNGSLDNNGNTKYEIPQTLVVVDASTDYRWTPSGIYSFQNSNYEVLYCCDADTGYNNGVYYKRTNLEDSSYYSAEDAAHIRSIVTNAYPFISLEQMKAELAAGGFEDAESLTRADVITAVQSAIWAFANPTISPYYYGRTFHVTTSTRWGGVMHDYTAEMGTPWWNTGAHKVTDKNNASSDAVLAEIIKVETRINSLIDYLKNLPPIDPTEDQVVISDLQIVDFTPIQKIEDLYTVSLQVKLNNSGSSVKDELKLDVYVDDTLYTTETVTLGQDTYNLKTEAAAGQKIKVVVSGTQILPNGVYFYEAEGGRELSQSLVGIAGGPTDVYSEAEVDMPEEDPITANVSLFKVDDNNQALAGAEFDLFAVIDSDDVYVDTFAVDENGALVIENLASGSYKITESKAPEGFMPLLDAIRFTVTENGEVAADSLPEGVTATTDNGFAVTCVNRYKYTEISGAKTWNDDGNRDGKRPESITVNLLADGVEVAEKTVTAADNWAWTFENLLKFRNDGTEIVYSVTEDEVAGYTAAYEGLNIINSRENETVDIQGSKTWVDDNNNDRTRPASITVRLFADGVEVASTSVTTRSNWTWSFNGMPKYRDQGVEIIYTVAEDAVEGYTTEVDGFNITNTLIPPRKNTTVINLIATKYLDGEAAGGYSFLLTDASGTVIDDAVSAPNGIVRFLPIEFTEAGIYRYQVREIAGREDGIIYDTAVYDVVVTVTEDEADLHASVTLYKNGTGYNGPIEFYNETDGLTEIPDEDVPLTGDNSNNPLFLTLMFSSVAAFAVTTYFTFKKKAL